MSGNVLSSQSMVNQNLTVALPENTYVTGVITTVGSATSTTVNLPSGVTININNPPTIVLSPNTAGLTIPSAYVAAWSSSAITIAPTAGGTWGATYIIRYALLNQF